MSEDERRRRTQDIAQLLRDMNIEPTKERTTMTKRLTRKNNLSRPPREAITVLVRRGTAQEIRDVAQVAGYSVSRVAAETLEAVFPAATIKRRKK
jgi:hypothetical protein